LSEGTTKTAGSGWNWKRIARRVRVPLGFCFAAVFLWLALPTWHSMAWSLLLVVPGVWLRGYAAGYVKKNAELTRTGPYAHTRNPLYLGSMMIAFGFAAAAGSWVILIALAALFLAIYWPTILSEEEYLRGLRCVRGEGASPAATGDSGERGWGTRKVLSRAIPAPSRVQCCYGRRCDLCGACDTIVVLSALSGYSVVGCRRSDVQTGN
jgi:hypothetical protein